MLGDANKSFIFAHKRGHCVYSCLGGFGRRRGRERRIGGGTTKEGEALVSSMRGRLSRGDVPILSPNVSAREIEE